MLQFFLNVIVSLVFLPLCFFWLFIKTLRTPLATNGIYSENGPWYYLKYVLFCTLLFLQKQFKKSSRRPLHDGIQLFPEDDHLGNDSIFFIGSCMKSGLTFIVATERRPHNVTYGLVYLMVILVSGTVLVSCTYLFSTAFKILRF